MNKRMAYINKSKSDDWTTPPDLYYKLHDKYDFDFDPCPLNPSFDGLNIEWGARNFVNPPYSQLKAWVKKAYEESLKGKLVVMLLPSRTDTIAFHKYIYKIAEIEFIKGRLKFGGCENPAPFPSMIVVYNG